MSTRVRPNAAVPSSAHEGAVERAVERAHARQDIGEKGGDVAGGAPAVGGPGARVRVPARATRRAAESTGPEAGVPLRIIGRVTGRLTSDPAVPQSDDQQFHLVVPVVTGRGARAISIAVIASAPHVVAALGRLRKGDILIATGELLAVRLHENPPGTGLLAVVATSVEQVRDYGADCQMTADGALVSGRRKPA
jgi:hypothetical protein